MLLAVATVLECRRPAFFQCAVTFAAVRAAGLEGADHLVGAACSVAFAWTAAVFSAETLADRGGGAARHGARLVYTTMDGAIATFLLRVCGASIKLALSICAMLTPDTPSKCKSITTVNLAHFSTATAVQPAPASCLYSCRAIVERADPVGVMRFADSTSNNTCTTPCSRADTSCTVLHAQPSPASIAAAACSRAGPFGVVVF